MSRRRTHQTTVPGELPRGPVDDIVWLVLFWVLSRIVMLCLWQALCGFIRNDVNYYAMSVAGRPVPVLSDLTGVLEEYPAPLVWLLQLLEAPSGGRPVRPALRAAHRGRRRGVLPRSASA